MKTKQYTATDARGRKTVCSTLAGAKRMAGAGGTVQAVNPSSGAKQRDRGTRAYTQRLPPAPAAVWDSGVKLPKYNGQVSITGAHGAADKAKVLLKLFPQIRATAAAELPLWQAAEQKTKAKITAYLRAGERKYGGLMTGGGSPVAGGTYSNWPQDYRVAVWPLHIKYNVEQEVAEALAYIAKHYKRNPSSGATAITSHGETREIDPNHLSYEDKRFLCGVRVKLNGEPAGIGGARNEFGGITQLKGCCHGEYAWSAIARGVLSGGNFKA